MEEWNVTYCQNLSFTRYRNFWLCKSDKVSIGDSIEMMRLRTSVGSFPKREEDQF